MIQFAIPGPPVGKGRPRFSRRGAFVSVHTPEKTASYESLVKMAAGEAMDGRPPLTEACECDIRVTMLPPASWSIKKQTSALNGEIFPTVKPDADNAAKLVCDACNGIVYMDDKQVVDLLVRKRYGVLQRVVVTVTLMSEYHA